MFARALVFGASLAIVACSAAADPLPASWPVAFSADFFYATRSGVANDPVIQDSVTGDALVGGDDFDFGWGPGVDLGLSIGDETVDFTGRFVGGLSFDSTVEATTPPIWNFATNPQIFGVGVAETTTTYTSDFNSLEFNSGRDFGPVNAFIGVRAVWFNDALGTAADFNGNAADVAWSVDTTGVGPQIGATWTGNAGPVLVNLDGRVGYLWTNSDADFSVTQDVGSAFGASDELNGGSAIAEAGISAALPLTRTLRLKAGYRVIWVESLPTALGSVAGTNALTGTVSASTDDLLIQGGTVGLSANF